MRYCQVTEVLTYRQAALTAVAAIALFDTDIRTAVTDELRLIPAIQASLANRYVGVRYAACQCARALSRAVSALRTNIVDTGLGLAVFQLFLKQDEDRRVMHAASAVICNIVTNFSPLRTVSGLHTTTSAVILISFYRRCSSRV